MARGSLRLAGMRTHTDLRRVAQSLLAAASLGPFLVVGCGSESDFATCDDSQPTGESGSGLEECKSGLVHRVSTATCDLPPEPNQCGANSQCETDADCSDAPNGHCSNGQAGGDCFCNYGCATDLDCGSGQLCTCYAGGGYCQEAGCTTDDDCSDGMCIQTTVGDKCGPRQFECQASGDECAVDEDCDGDTFCVLVDGARECITGTEDGCAVEGRPFLVDGIDRKALPVARADWNGSVDAAIPADAELAMVLADRWTEIGLMEHASIAAFARFSLQLLELGAPAALIEETNQALVDETRHARACFALASRFSGAPVGPGRLLTQDALSSCTLAEVVRLVIDEGCIGETIAAVTASEMAASATDPAIAQMLTDIAADELRHAELAWRFVRWAMDQGDEDTLAAARASLSNVENRIFDDGDEHAHLPEHGLIGSESRRALERTVLRQIVAPCGRALLATQETPMSTIETTTIQATV